MTVTLYNYIRSELIKKGFNEFVDKEGNLIFFDEHAQFMGKIFSYDEDVSSIVNHLFTGYELDNAEFDEHFKKTFVTRFLNRSINRQTIDVFRMQLLNTFLTNKRYINFVYSNLDKYLHKEDENTSLSKQSNQQKNDATSLTDNRSAFANLPQNNVQIDVNDTVMTSASDNTISRNKQTNNQETTGVTDGQTTTKAKIYNLDELFKTNGLEEQIFNEFDRKCFLQVW